MAPTLDSKPAGTYENVSNAIQELIDVRMHTILQQIYQYGNPKRTNGTRPWKRSSPPSSTRNLELRPFFVCVFGNVDQRQVIWRQFNQRSDKSRRLTSNPVIYTEVLSKMKSPDLVLWQDSSVNIDKSVVSEFVNAVASP